MKIRIPARKTAAAVPLADFPAFLASVGVVKVAVHYRRGQAIFTQGEPCTHVLYVQTGSVKLSVLSTAGREAIVGLLSPGDFFGEECLTGRPLRPGSATAMMSSVIVSVPKERMAELLRTHHPISNRFIAHMLMRNSRIESDLVDQLFNSTEKRLARALLLLAGYGTDHKPTRTVPKISQATLGEMIGTTRSRVNFFLNKFKRLGFIKYDSELPPTINRSLLSVVLRD
jgi:CRP/FNR family cyclic AMP-dependent transcriptional regulator